MASGIEKYILDRNDYTPLVPQGIQLPSWFYNVQPVSFYDGIKQQLGIEQAQQTLKANEQKLEDLAQERESKTKKSEAIQGADTYEEALSLLKQVAKETGDPDEFLNLSGKEEQIAASKAKAGKPEIRVSGGNVIRLYPDGNYEIVGTLPQKESAGRQPTPFKLDRYDENGNRRLVDPRQLGEAENAGYKFEYNPKPKLSPAEQLFQLLQAKGAQETQGRAIDPAKVNIIKKK